MFPEHHISTLECEPVVMAVKNSAFYFFFFHEMHAVSISLFQKHEKNLTDPKLLNGSVFIIHYTSYLFCLLYLMEQLFYPTQMFLI